MNSILSLEMEENYKIEGVVYKLQVRPLNPVLASELGDSRVATLSEEMRDIEELLQLTANTKDEAKANGDIEKLKELQKESRMLSKSLRGISVKIAKASEELHREIFNARVKGEDSKKLEDKLLKDNLFSLVVPQITDSYDTKKN
jgi:Fe2+ transport system protein B